MVLSQSDALVTGLGGRFEWLESATSTNSLLLAKPDLPHFSVLATDNQIAGRGRAGRVWQAPAGASLAISVLLKPQLSSGNLNQLGWLPLLAGLAMSRTVAPLVEGKTGVKWPNDVLVSDRKISGVLSELLPDLSGLVIGAGLNIHLTEEQLPVATATSLQIEGAVQLATDYLLSSYLQNLHLLYSSFALAEFDANRSGLRAAVTANCLTLGRQVKAVMPGDSEIFGKAVALDDDGRIVLEVDGKLVAVAAGDIVHMRHN
ncbi:MAG: biotin--[acetyl-CoA-carboxylase] ligase [Micrococcales bacterium]